MDKTWTKALRDSISEVFSTMFFMVPEEEEGLADRLAAEDAAGWLEGWVEITRPGESVRLWVWAGPGLAKELAGNILSLEIFDVHMDRRVREAWPAVAARFRASRDELLAAAADTEG